MSLETDMVMEQGESLETAIGQVETIIKQMEASDIPLETSFQLYQKGIEKLKSCNELLDTVEKRMLVLSQKGDLEDF